MRIRVSNSKILLTIVQRGLAIVIVIILFTLGSSIYFYQKIAQSWRDSTYQKADTIMTQMELRVSNYHNIIRTMEDNRQILYLNAQKDQKFSYRETSCIAQLSDLIVNLISPIPEISNIYVYFNRTDLMVDRAGSSNLSAFQRYGGNPSGYAPPNNGNLNQIASVLQNNSQYQSADPYLFTVEHTHYLVFCRKNLAFLIQINVHTLNQQMSRLLPLREAAVQVRWPDGKYLTSNVQEQLSQVFQKENSFTMDRAYGLQYSFHFNKLSASIIIKCTETQPSPLCIFLFISTQNDPEDGGEKNGEIPLPDLRGQETDRGVASERRPAGRHRGPPIRPLHHDLQRAPARRDRRAGQKPARGVQRRARREAAP